MIDRLSLFTNAWLNSAIVAENSSNRLNSLADKALRPWREMFQGYRIELSPSRKVEVLNAGFTPTILKVILLVPQLLVGLVAKTIALGSSEVRANISSAMTLLKQKEENELLADRYKALKLVIDSCTHLLSGKGKAYWKNEACIHVWDLLMQDAVRKMDELTSRVAEVAKQDPKVMMELIMQPWGDDGDHLYSHCFFNDSLWHIYEMARNFCVINPDGTITAAEYDPADEVIFFDGKSKQNAWRNQFNALLEKFETYKSADGTTFAGLLKEEIGLTQDVAQVGNKNYLCHTMDPYNWTPEPLQ
jgi:hypothetical protein